MTLQKFPLLQDNTRLIKFKDTLYKVKIKYQLDTFEDRRVTFNQVEAHDEIEQTFRAVLYLSERNQTLKTIATSHFLIQPYKFPWSFPRKCCDYSFQQNGKSLKVFDHVFELHVTNRKAEKYVPGKDSLGNKGEDDFDVSNCRTKDDKLKEAVIVVTDINSEASTRFGRTSDGQLYRVFANKTVPGQTSTPAKGGEYVGYRHQHESPKKSKNHTGQHVEIENVEKAVKTRSDNKVLNTSSLHSKPEGRKTQSQKKVDGNKINEGYKKDERTPLSGGKKTETSIQKLLTPRDKFSLRTSELRELKIENVQAQRLRGRKETKISHKVGTREVKHNSINSTQKKEFNIEGTKNTATIQGGRLTSSKHKNKEQETIRKVKKEQETIRKVKKNIHTNSVILSAKQQIGTKKIGRSGLKEGMHVKKIKRTRQLRGTRRRNSRTKNDISSQSDLESLYQSADNDADKRFNTNDFGTKTRSKQSSIKTLDQTESEQDEPVSSENEVESKKKSLRNSKRYDVANLKRLDVTVSKRKKNDAGERHSKVFAKETKNALVRSADFDLNRSPRKARPDLKRKLEASESRRVRRSRSSQMDDSSLSSSETRGRTGSGYKADSLSSSSDAEKRSPRKSRRLEQRREGYTSSEIENVDEKLSGRSQGSAMPRKTKLYASRHSPQIVVDLECKRVVELSSPRVSTVLPVKRSRIDVSPSQRSQPGVSSPSSQRITRQSLQDEELRRIQGLREERPTQIYRDIMLAQGRDRYLVEQAESMETDKLRQLYEPTVPSNEHRVTVKKAAKRRRSSGLWGKIMDNLVTPTKKYIIGKK